MVLRICHHFERLESVFCRVRTDAHRDPGRVIRDGARSLHGRLDRCDYLIIYF